VVVITSPLHGEGPQFDPEWKHFRRSFIDSKTLDVEGLVFYTERIFSFVDEVYVFKNESEYRAHEVDILIQSTRNADMNKTIEIVLKKIQLPYIITE